MPGLFWSGQREFAPGNDLQQAIIIGDFPVGSKSSKEVWILSNSSRAASSRSIRLLIVLGVLLGRDRAPTDYAFQGPNVGTLTVIMGHNGVYSWMGIYNALVDVKRNFGAST